MVPISFGLRAMSAALLPIPLLLLVGYATTTVSIGADLVACSAFEAIGRSKGRRREGPATERIAAWSATQA